MIGLTKTLVSFFVWRRLAVLVSIMSGVLIVSHAQAQESFRTASFDSFASSDSLTLDGKTSVIVEYSTPGNSVSSLSKMSDSEASDAMSAAKSFFELGMSAVAKEGIMTTFDYFPGVVMEVDQAVLKELQANENVQAIYPNQIYRPNLAESRPLVLQNLATSEFTGKDWTVAVLDTGSDNTHSFLSLDGATRVVSEACYSGAGIRDPRVKRLCPGNAQSSTAVNSGRNCTGFQGCNHGTHVAGIAAGNGPNFSGIASEANIIAIQVFTALRSLTGRDREICGGDTSCILSTDGELIKGLERVYQLRNTFNIASVNFSLGGGRFSGSCAGSNPALTAVIARLKSVGIATVAASGNGGLTGEISSPACIPDVIAVGATSDFTGTRFGRSFQLDVPTFYSNFSPSLDIFAPGSAIVSSVPGNTFATFDGTSMASPHVAGAFAVLRQAKPDLTVDEIEVLLKSVGPDVSSFGMTRKRLDLKAALQKLGVTGAAISPILDLLLQEP